MQSADGKLLEVVELEEGAMALEALYDAHHGLADDEGRKLLLATAALDLRLALLQSRDRHCEHVSRLSNLNDSDIYLVSDLVLLVGAGHLIVVEALSHEEADAGPALFEADKEVIFLVELYSHPVLVADLDLGRRGLGLCQPLAQV